MTGWLLLILGLLSAASVANARWPRRSLLLVMPSWFGAFIAVELAVHLLALSAALVVLLVLLGALDTTVGWIGLALWAIAALGSLPWGAASLRTRISVDGRPEDLDLSSDAPRIPWYLLLVPLAGLWRPGVRYERGVVYREVDGIRLRLDIVRPKRDPGRPLPAIIHVHGGAWFFGSRKEQGWPLLNHLAANGWVGFNINYRLSPHATLPEHVEDVKYAIAWVREHAEELGVDPEFIAITGGSAGGHLTALAALTADDRSLQPGFEDADTHVQAAVPFYGIYDMTDPEREHLKPLRQIVEWIVMKARIDREPEKFRAMSPIHRVHPDAPPFFIIHGDGDTLVPVGESRRFSKRLREVSRQPVLYAEMPGGQHAFDVFPTWRSAPVIRAVERFLHATYATRRKGAEATERAAGDALTA
jgi:acetyl esterase/lipase